MFIIKTPKHKRAILLPAIPPHVRLEQHLELFISAAREGIFSTAYQCENAQQARMIMELINTPKPPTRGDQLRLSLE